MDWTPYTIATVITVTTGEKHNYAVNFAVLYLAFASGLVFISVASFCSPAASSTRSSAW